MPVRPAIAPSITMSLVGAFASSPVPRFSLSPLTGDRLDAVLELDRRCFGGLWNAAGYQRELDSPNSELLGFSRGAAAAANTELLALGCYWAILDEAHITLLAVEPAYQRQGLGLAMLYALMQSAQARNLERATLEVRISNHSAIALYEKLSFRTAGRRKRYYEDTGEDALILWRSGLQHPHFADELRRWRHQVGDRLRQSGWEWVELSPDITHPEIGQHSA